MKLLLFSDVHRDQGAARQLVELSRTVDVVVGAGDFCTVRRGLPEIIRALSAIERPSVLVAGNAETDAELCSACSSWPSAHVLHGSGVTIGGRAFFGLGGAVPVTPFGAWSFDLSEAEAAALLEDCPPAAILVTHAPPQGAVDRASSGTSLGSTAIRAVIERTRPVLAVCGHIHDSAARTEFIGQTPVVNAGPAGVVYELPDE